MKNDNKSSAFTAGPWFVIKDQGQPTNMIQSQKGISVIVRADKESPCWKGNATLVAAAPEMYEALYALLGEIEDGYAETEQSAGVRKARAALDKAEGK